MTAGAGIVGIRIREAVFVKQALGLLPAAAEFGAAQPLRGVDKAPPCGAQLARGGEDFVIRPGGTVVSAKQLGVHA